jgi:ABC-type branched-subunit amino acid transport system ATPase component
MTVEAKGDVVLEVDNVTMAYGRLLALNDVSVRITSGRTVGLIGPNGAGKSTLLNVIAGAITPTSGTVTYLGQDVTRQPTSQRARAGLRRTFQHLELFEDMTVLENVLVSTDMHRGRRWPTLRPGDTSEVIELLHSLGLTQVLHADARALPHPTKRLVSYARAVAGHPHCVLLDEPVAGLAETEREAFVERLRGDMLRRDLTVVLVEHDMRFIQGLCDEVYVLNAGQVIAHGSFAEVAASDAVKTAYLGESVHG